MRHTDPDLLALAALGEPLDAADRAHVDECPDCARELDALSAAAAVGRSARDDAPVPAPAGVWERVRDELGLDPELDAVAGAGRGADAGPAAAVAPHAEPAPGAAVVPLPRRRTRRALLAVAAAGLVVGGTAGGLVVAGLQRGDQEQVVASTVLDALPGWAASGDAVVEEDAEGRRTLVVRLEGGEADGFREVWLLDRDVTGLVSLGMLDGDEGRFAIPAGLDLGRYPVVDVSAEPDDGDPAHSGDSILRGELTAPA